MSDVLKIADFSDELSFFSELPSPRSESTRLKRSILRQVRPQKKRLFGFLAFCITEGKIVGYFSAV
jgi:hypothetical protein